MFERLKDLRRRDPDQAAARAQRRADRKARRAERKDPTFERGAADAEAQARHYGNLGRDGGGGGGGLGGGG
jgi:hypothetical protein